MTFKRKNDLLGWLSFFISAVVYMLSAERSASFWDCGEFISASYLLQVVHPPGAPFFLLLGNLFAQLAPGPMQVAFMVNMLSVITSALCVMFTFWTITHFAKKMADEANELMVLGAGMVGALALAFSDTFWFSAVEAEVYASSSFFTALTFWAILKWERIAEQPLSNKWLILIAYLIGLGIGVHLLNLLVIPAIVLVVWFRFNAFSWFGFLKTLLVAAGILGFVQVGIIPGLPALAASFDLTAVNTLGMPFGSGVWALLLLVVTVISGGIYFTHIKKFVVWNTALLCIAFVLIGYSSYTMVVVRSLAEPTIDMNNPEEPFNFLSYINREQYGDRPLLKGPYFNAPAIDYKMGKMDYRKGENGYEEAGKRIDYEYDPRYLTIFPRMGDMRENSKQGYDMWVNASGDAPPKFSQNLAFFFKYQMGHMYWRYFMWNFAGRQNDIQGDGDPLRGNWISGIPFLDGFRLGPQTNLPDELGKNLARNKYFLLPFLLGIAGLLFQFQTNRNDFLVMVTLFLFTGILIAVYLNAPPFEPRERDYTLVGSFQIFCIWLGLGVFQLALWLSKKLGVRLAKLSAVTIGVLGGPLILFAQNWDDHNRSQRTMVTEYAKNYLNTCAPGAILFTNGDNDTYPLWYVQNVEGYRTDVRVVNLQLLNFDWYVEALTRKVMDSEPFKLSVEKRKYAKGLREQVMFFDKHNLNINVNDFFAVDRVIQFITSDEPQTQRPMIDRNMNFLPVKNLYFNIDQQEVLQNKVVAETDKDRIETQMRFTLPNSGLLKADWVVLDLIQQNLASRPIYFASNSISNNHLGLADFMRLDGLAYRLVPTRKNTPAQVPIYFETDRLAKSLMETFSMGGVKQEGLLLEETTLRMCRTFRNYFAYLATQYLLEGKNAEAIKAIKYCKDEIPAHISYGSIQMISPLIQGAYQANDVQLGDNLAEDFLKEQAQWFRYLSQFKGERRGLVAGELNRTIDNLSKLQQLLTQNNRSELQQKTNQIILQTNNN